jgi:hypothetical protein
MIHSIRITPAYQLRDCILFFVFMALVTCAFTFAGYENATSERTSQQQKAERVRVLLRTCFPEGIYREVTPVCRNFKNYLMTEALP